MKTVPRPTAKRERVARSLEITGRAIRAALAAPTGALAALLAPVAGRGNAIRATAPGLRSLVNQMSPSGPVVMF